MNLQKKNDQALQQVNFLPNLGLKKIIHKMIDNPTKIKK